MTFIDDIKRSYLQGSMLLKLIFINIGVFLLLHLLALGALLVNAGDSMLSWVSLPSDLSLLLRRPWTLLTYMFAHYGVMHILFNMLWLYWLGRIFMEFFSSKQLTAVYILGGLGGAVLYLLAYNLLPHLALVRATLVGASASVIAIVVATAVYAPEYKIGLLFLGEVPLKWIAIITIAIDLLSLDAGNMGGSIAHIGGAIVGAWFALRIKRGHDITRPLNAAIDAVVGFFNGRSLTMPKFGRQSTENSPHHNNHHTPRANTPNDLVDEEELDMILGKIKAAGYDALSDEEKDKLFKASRRRSV